MQLSSDDETLLRFVVDRFNTSNLMPFQPHQVEDELDMSPERIMRSARRLNAMGALGLVAEDQVHHDGVITPRAEAVDVLTELEADRQNIDHVDNAIRWARRQRWLAPVILACIVVIVLSSVVTAIGTLFQLFAENGTAQ